VSELRIFDRNDEVSIIERNLRMGRNRVSFVSSPFARTTYRHFTK
jgi:hypothetical protein